MLKMIGFDRYIELKWLNNIAAMRSLTYDHDSIHKHMHEILINNYPKYEARRKTITVLTKIWVRIPNKLEKLQQQALLLFNEVKPSEFIWIQWGMVLVTYPFFRDIVSTIGRLLLLQTEITSNEIHLRMEKKWGKRTTLIRAINRVLQSMYEWNIICQGKDGNILIPPKKITNNKKLQLWLIEAFLRSESVDSLYLPQIFNSSTLFPFSITISRLDLQKSTIFEYSRYNLNNETIIIKSY